MSGHLGFGSPFRSSVLRRVVATGLMASAFAVAARAQAVAGCDDRQKCAIETPDENDALGDAPDARPADSKRDEPGSLHRAVLVERVRRPDRNREIYYKNKLEFSIEVGYLPVNIPFVFNFATGDPYSIDDPLRYTLMPIIASLRWQPDNIAGPLFLRGNWDVSVSLAVTPIVKGPETHYVAYVMGIRRNFVHRNWKLAPYLDGRVGAGHEDATGPKGVVYGQGQDFAFTVMLGGGIRYNVSPRYAFWLGTNYMHISNLYMSEPRYWNWGINVIGPMIGMEIQLRPHRHRTIASNH